MIGSFVIPDRLFEIVDALLWPLKEPTRASHVREDSAEHITRRMIANQLNCLIKILEPSFVIPFVNVRGREAKICFSQAAPVAALPITFQRATRIVTSNRILGDIAIDTRQRRVSRSGHRSFFRRIAQRRLQN